MAADEIHMALGESSLGLVLVAKSAHGLCAVLLGDDGDTLKSELQRRFPRAVIIQGDAGAVALAATVVGIVESPARGVDLAVDLRGSDFQRRVWRALRGIPAGETATYADIANRIGRPKSARAVAQACAANHLAVVVPCHRVVRSNGDLSGYRWGIQRKRALLEREVVALREEPAAVPR
jgi:AraC family transcriptional regulator of adaptative response/methylated-DNA-[protein]-cysteine methyltransferase